MNGSLTILDFPGKPALLVEESRTVGSVIEEEDVVGGAGRTWRALSTAALSEDDSVRLVEWLATALRSSRELRS